MYLVKFLDTSAKRFFRIFLSFLNITFLKNNKCLFEIFNRQIILYKNIMYLYS